jgi:hypothetical protein
METVRVFHPYAGYGDFVWGPNDDRPDNTPDDVPTVVEKIRELGPINAALAKKSSGMDISRSWLEVPTDDLDDDSGQLDKGLMVITTARTVNTLAKRTRPEIAKTTTRVDGDGFTWLESFDAGGQLLDSKVLLTKTED